jgi:sugar O-acyltransferase (sialic acid O-acetyltransferase NeuD family)
MPGKTIILVGGFHEMIELCEQCNVNIAGIFDNQLQGEYLGYKILGSDQDAINHSAQFRHYPVILSPDSPTLREKLFHLYQEAGYTFDGLISPTARISRTSHIDPLAVIQHGVNVSSNVAIGRFVKLNSLCNIMHDSIVQEFTTVAPNAVILGYVKIGRNCYIGANSTILPKQQLGNRIMVGAGAVVTRDIPDDHTMVGVPARSVSREG